MKLLVAQFYTSSVESWIAEKNIAIKCIKHMNTSVMCKHIISSMKHT